MSVITLKRGLQDRIAGLIFIVIPITTMRYIGDIEGYHDRLKPPFPPRMARARERFAAQ